MIVDVDVTCCFTCHKVMFKGDRSEKEKELSQRRNRVRIFDL